MPVNNEKNTEARLPTSSEKDASSLHRDPQQAPWSAAKGFPWLALLKLACGLSLVGFLFWQASAADGFDRLIEGKINIGWFGISIALILVCLFFGSLRWQCVAKATALPLTLHEAFRWSAIGFASSLVSLGNTGGDVVKATLLARKRPGQMATAISTIFVDRLVGLLIMLLFASGAILLSGIAALPESGQQTVEVLSTDPMVTESLSASNGALQILCRSTLVVTLIAIACFLTVLAPGKPLVWLANYCRGIPWIGPLLVNTALLCDRYQRGWRWLLLSILVGLIDNTLLVGSFYAVAMALPMPAPNLLEHYFIVPFAFIAGALPISPSGLGTFEAAVELLYQGVSTNGSIAPGDGTFVAFGHRLVMLLAAGLATVYFFATKPSSTETNKEKTAKEPQVATVNEPSTTGSALHSASTFHEKDLG